MPPANLSEQLKHWSSLLEPFSESPRLDAEILLKHVSGLSDTQLIVFDKEPLEKGIIKRVDDLVAARSHGSPIAYLTGWREFYSLNLKINQHVLIPRPETELLVDTALSLIQSMPSPRILDMGTGSGAIALAIASNAIHAELLATDVNEKALELAAENARLHHIESIKFLNSSWYSGLAEERFDLIVSNPPYIDPEDPHLSQGDVRFEPKQALIAADRGRADITEIAGQATDHLKPGGWIALEHGYDQGEFTRALLKSRGFSGLKTLKDLNRHERGTRGCYPQRQNQIRRNQSPAF